MTSCFIPVVRSNSTKEIHILPVVNIHAIHNTLPSLPKGTTLSPRFWTKQAVWLLSGFQPLFFLNHNIALCAEDTNVKAAKNRSNDVDLEVGTHRLFFFHFASLHKLC